MTLKPLDDDEMVPVWWSPASGTFEFLCGAAAARELLDGGMAAINGEPCRVEVVDRPKLGGVHVRATTSGPVRC